MTTETHFSFRARLIVEVLELAELDLRSSDCTLRIFVNSIKRKLRSKSVENGHTHFAQPESLTFGGDEHPDEIITLQDFLRIQAFAKDKVWKREIGACETRIAEKINTNEQCVTAWYRLKNLEGKETGKVLIRLTFSGDETGVGPIDPLHNIETASTSSATTSVTPSGALFSHNLFKASIHGQPLHAMVEARWIFRIRIHACRNLRVADTLVGTSDPFCEIKVRNDTKFTHIVFRDLNPVFPNLTIEFGEALDVLGPNDDVTILVYDHDRLKHSDFLGCIRAPIWTLCAEDMKPQWFELVSLKAMNNSNAAYMQEEHRTHGKILLSAEFVRPKIILPMTLPLPSTNATHRRSVFRSSVGKGEHRSGQSALFLDAEPKPHEAPPPSLMKVLQDRSTQLTDVYKPYKGKIWLYRLEVTALQVRSMDPLAEQLATPVIQHEEGPPNKPITTKKIKPAAAAVVSFAPSTIHQASSRGASLLFSSTTARKQSVEGAPNHTPSTLRSFESSGVPHAQRLSRKLFCEMRCGGQSFARSEPNHVVTVTIHPGEAKHSFAASRMPVMVAIVVCVLNMDVWGWR